MNPDFKPREKLSQRGMQSLTDVDLISIILGSGVKDFSVFDISREITKKIDKVKYSEGEKGLRALTFGDEVKGLGKIKSMRILCAIELGRRLYCEESLSAKILCKQDVVNLMAYLSNRKREYAVVILLDARNRLIKKKTVAVGSLNRLVVEPRDIFIEAIKASASGIILVHNHPSGNTDPSSSDLEFTNRIKSAGKILGIPLIDHVIV